MTLAACLLLCALNGPAAPPELWFYQATNLLVDDNVAKLEALLERAGKAGYVRVLLADSKFSRLAEMDARYFRNIERVRNAAAAARIEVVPAIFPIGYSNDLLSRDPQLAEALPVQGALFEVRDGCARLVADPPVSLPGGACDDLSRWSWKDETVAVEDAAACVRNPAGRNARLVQKLKVAPHRQYHVSVRIRTEEFEGTPEIKALAGDRALCFSGLGVKRSQDWTVHHTVFNSLEHGEVSLYFGCWDGRGGTLWWDDARIEEIGLLNVVRREGAPLVVCREYADSATLKEGEDFERVVDPDMGVHPWPGEYQVWHEPPVIRTKLPDGTRLRVSYSHAITVYDGQVMICPSEPKTRALLEDQMKRMHAAWHASAYFMSHDEVRVLNQDQSCRRRGLDAGQILAENVRDCRAIVREVAPQARVYAWSDMFDPQHNAVRDYYLVRGDLAGSWEGLERDVVVANWNFDKRDASLRWFAEHGHRQVLAGYYDGPPEQVGRWLDSAAAVKGVEGVMYTTWRGDYSQLERFSELVRGWRPAK